jgi:outer membrane immunogenic protein
MIYSKLLGAGVILVAAAMPGVANAADPYVPVSDVWTGPYIGAFGGYASLEADGTFDFTEIEDGGPVEGFLLGGQIGYNKQFESAVLGLEADIAWSDADGTLQNEEGEEAETDMDYLATVRGRAGMVFGETDSTLLFATAGVVFGGFEIEADDGEEGIASDENTHFGLVVGAGVEHLVTDSISIKAEYNYMMLGTEDYDDIEGRGENISFDGHVVKLGVNFHF